MIDLAPMQENSLLSDTMLNVAASETIKGNVLQTARPIMKIAFDTSALHPTFKAHAHRGIGRYVRELKMYFSKRQGEDSEHVAIRNFDFVELKSGAVDAVLNLVPVGRQTLRQQFVYPFSLARASKGCDYLHFPAQMDAPAWGRRKYVLTVHDLIPLVCADLYRSATQNWKFVFGRWLELCSIKNASHIIAISESTSKDLQRLLQIAPEKISVTHLGVDSKFLAVTRLHPEAESRLRKQLKIPETRRIILYVGGIDPRKNYQGLLETARRLILKARERNEVPPCVVIAGNIQLDREYPKLLELIKKLSLDNDVILTGFVSDNDLLDLYGISSVLFFPSLYEGFGLTPLEALAAGLPVVTSNTSAMPEVVGDAAVLVSPTNYDECVEGISSILENSDRALDLSHRGRARAKLFSWDKTGAETVKVYERLAPQN